MTNLASDSMGTIRRSALVGISIAFFLIGVLGLMSGPSEDGVSLPVTLTVRDVRSDGTAYNRGVNMELRQRCDADPGHCYLDPEFLKGEVLYLNSDGTISVRTADDENLTFERGYHQDGQWVPDPNGDYLLYDTYGGALVYFPLPESEKNAPD